jgi:hypothetical protein
VFRNHIGIDPQGKCPSRLRHTEMTMEIFFILFLELRIDAKTQVKSQYYRDSFKSFKLI